MSAKSFQNCWEIKSKSQEEKKIEGKYWGFDKNQWNLLKASVRKHTHYSLGHNFLYEDNRSWTPCLNICNFYLNFITMQKKLFK